MVAAFIFVLHILAAGYTFLSQRKKGGIGEGVLAVGFMGIVFAVGWTISTVLTNLLFTPDFFVRWYYTETDSVLLRVLRQEINRDTISLLVLTFAEIFFYYLFLRNRENSKSTLQK
ncbi:MAG: hypothetical protein WD182_08945 [Bacteroidota bacterium]